MSKKDLPSIKLLSNNGIMCTKKAFKIFIKWIKQNYPKPGLKVARKTISFCLARIPMKVLCWKGIGLKNACKTSKNAWIASKNVLNTYIGLFIYVQLSKRQASLCPLSTNLITEEVISFLANTVISAKLRAWYGICFTSTRKVAEARSIHVFRSAAYVWGGALAVLLFLLRLLFRYLQGFYIRHRIGSFNIIYCDNHYWNVFYSEDVPWKVRTKY